MISSSSSCTLPPISDLFPLPRRNSNSSLSSDMKQHHPIATSINTNHNSVDKYRNCDRNTSNNKLAGYYPTLKAKRKRASASQLSVLNQVFSQTYFPSTELRIELGKHLGMSPRTVQIWFQNKRQSLRSRTQRFSFSSMEGGEIEVEEENTTSGNYYSQRNQYDITGSPPCTPTFATGNDHDYFIPQPPSSPVLPSSSPIIKDDDYYRNPQKVNLPPLRLHQNTYYPPSPPSSTYSSPISIDSILH